MPSIARGRFRPELLPPALGFYEAELGKLSRPSRGWAKADCPFHESQSHTSLSVNEDGGFYCFGCQAKGDMVTFVRRRYGMSFEAAAKYLGAWDDHKFVYKPRPTVPVRFLILDFIIDGVAYRAEVRDEPKDDLQRMRWFYHEAIENLEADRESEVHWGIAAAAWELIEMEISDGI